jgi:cellulose synthase/poly-beta-1,6-N-acetylglucosamine synthase-like glycosyltransferase
MTVAVDMDSLHPSTRAPASEMPQAGASFAAAWGIPGSMPAPGLPDISVVIPARDEAGAIAPLLAEIATALAGEPYEIIVVDDGSADATAAVISEIAMAQP